MLFLQLFMCISIFRISFANVIVEIESGKVRGEVLFNWDKQTYYSFKSIPYAKPPIGALRFKAPISVESWKGVLDANKASPVCPQFYYNELIGQEDCLYLNVYTKSLDPNIQLPVMVYMHGGGYYQGTGSSSSYGPEFLLTQQIVLVTFDYRLGYLGTLNFKDQSQGVPGNANLKDQVMVLKWVQKHIASFGGNKDLVTAFGESAGGASVHMHMLSPMSKGLVHRVIAQSGCALNAWNYGVSGTGELIANKLGIIGNNTQELITKLQEIPMEILLRNTRHSDNVPVGVLVDTFNDFSPVLEAQTNEPAFLQKLPADLIPESENIPLMLGYNSNDSLTFQVMERLYTGSMFSFPDLNKTIPWDVQIPNQVERAKVLASINKTFFRKQTIDTKNVGSVSRYGLGPWFITGYLQAIEKHLEANHSVYFYKFSTDTKLNFLKRLHPVTARYKGACHMDELGHLFTTPYTPCFVRNSPEDVGWRTLVQIWTNFAKFGNPTLGNNTFNSWNVKWSTVTDAKNIAYLNIDGAKLEEKRHPDRLVFDYWKNIYKKYNDNF